MIYKVMGFHIFAVFYMFYLAKLIIQKRQSIRTNQMGVGNKSKKVLNIERIMSVATFSTVVVTLYSIFVGKGIVATHLVPESFRLAGIVVGVFAVFFFASATIVMKNNWRVGIPEEKTSLVTEGIYKWSRNPAFVGFDMLYLSMCLLFFNIPLVMVSVWAAVMLHLQILQEEEHMQKMFGTEYDSYKNRTGRYFGRRASKEHLPLTGVGPIYVIIIISATVLGIMVRDSSILRSGRIEVLRIPFLVLGTFLGIFGLSLWARANFESKLGENIKKNTLVTTGVYAHVRNPIYSAFMLICTGALLVANNLWLLLLPIFYWLFMTFLMKNTEEKWLYRLYGEPYLEYCKKVNRCIPWF